MNREKLIFISLLLIVHFRKLLYRTSRESLKNYFAEILFNLNSAEKLESSAKHDRTYIFFLAGSTCDDLS